MGCPAQVKRIRAKREGDLALQIKQRVKGISTALEVNVAPSFDVRKHIKFVPDF